MLTSPDEVLNQLVAASTMPGWATATIPLSQFQSYAGRRGWEPIATRRGDSAVANLTPTAAAAAPARSISATAGLDAQMLHVDGAHLYAVPDIVVMHSETVSSTITRIWRPKFEILNSSALKHGVFIVGVGRDSFLACAYDYNGLRFDPYCMAPADSRSREAYDLLTSYEGVHEHVWSEPNTLLLIRNRKVLHGRAKTVEGENRELTRIAYKTGPLR